MLGVPCIKIFFASERAYYDRMTLDFIRVMVFHVEFEEL